MIESLVMNRKERFLAKVEKSNRCWLWVGATKSRNPDRAYGQFWDGGRARPAAQVAWEMANGKSFPIGMDALHHCDNPRCVNPDHIFPGTASDNAKDASAKKRLLNSSKMHCKRGHLLLGDDLIIRYDGSRECHQCKIEWERTHRSVAVGYHRRDHA